MTQVRDERCEAGGCMASFRLGGHAEVGFTSLFGCTKKAPNLYQCTSIVNGQQDDCYPVWCSVSAFCIDYSHNGQKNLQNSLLPEEIDSQFSNFMKYYISQRHEPLDELLPVNGNAGLQKQYTCQPPNPC